MQKLKTLSLLFAAVTLAFMMTLPISSAGRDPVPKTDNHFVIKDLSSQFIDVSAISTVAYDVGHGHHIFIKNISIPVVTDADPTTQFYLQPPTRPIAVWRCYLERSTTAGHNNVIRPPNRE